MLKLNYYIYILNNLWIELLCTDSAQRFYTNIESYDYFIILFLLAMAERGGDMGHGDDMVNHPQNV